MFVIFFQIHPINITESTKSPNTNLSTPWTVESGTMCELDVFVGNYAIIDWEVYSLWLSGRSIAEAGPFKIFLCELAIKSSNRVSQIEMYSDVIRSDLRLWRSFDK